MVMSRHPSPKSWLSMFFIWGTNQSSFQLLIPPPFFIYCNFYFIFIPMCWILLIYFELWAVEANKDLKFYLWHSLFKVHWNTLLNYTLVLVLLQFCSGDTTDPKLGISIFELWHLTLMKYTQWLLLLRNFDEIDTLLRMQRNLNEIHTLMNTTAFAQIKTRTKKLAYK